MGIAAVRMKIMPSSPEINLDEIINQAKKLIEGKSGKNVTFEVEPIAFGLKAILPFFAIDEKNDLSEIESELSQIENVNSVQIVDMRRAFG